jgi:transposase-like protein
MSARREGEQNPYWKRMEIVMKVYIGQMNVTDAAKELGVTRAYYYQLEEEMLRAALGAVTPQKPGPKKAIVDPVKETMELKLKETEREKELLQIKLKHLEEIQKEMISRGIGVLREKKQSVGRVPQRHRKKVHGAIQADGSLETGRGTPPGRDGEKRLPGSGAQPSDSVPVEGQGSRKEDGAQETRGRTRRGDGVGDPILGSEEGRTLGNPSDLRLLRRSDPPEQDQRGAR